MLLALYEGQLTKTDLTTRFRSVSAAEREKLINKLVKDGLVEGELRPTPNSRKTPLFYFLTDSGKKWVANYLNTLKRG
jgi:DNA-binding PadR family transcriptional regulator